MDDTAPDLKPVPLNNFSHRSSASPSISEPSDLVTEPTPAQRERLVYLVDDALDTLEDAMAPGNKISDRLSAANSALDRAGLHNKAAAAPATTVAPIPAEALVQVIAGLAQVFGQKVKVDPRDVTPPPPPADPPAPSPVPKPPRKQAGGLPADLLNHYEGDP